MNLGFSLDFHAQHPFEGQIEQRAPQTGVFRGERTAPHPNFKLAQFSFKLALIGGSLPIDLGLGAVESVVKKALRSCHIVHPHAVPLGQTHHHAICTMHHRLTLAIDRQLNAACAHEPSGRVRLQQKTLRKQSLRLSHE